MIDVRSGKDYKHLDKGNIPVYGTGGYMLSVDSALSNDEDAIGIGRKGTIDKPYLLRAPFWTVDTLFYAVPKPKFKLDYLYCLFQKIDWKKHDESTSVPSLSKVAINNIPIRVTSEQEQTQIGNYFQKLDSLINQHQQKHDKLSNIKKAMLEKMFPKQGETVPEIRFKGFSGEWERNKLGECFNERVERCGEGELISVTINSGIKRFRELGRHDNSSDDKSNYKKVEVGDIAYNSMRMWQGSSGYSPYSGILSPAYTVIVPRENIDSLFFSYLIKKPEVIQVFQNSSQGITSDTWNLKFPAFSKIKIMRPDLDEQTAIGNYFQKLDTLINQHQQQITKLNNIKQACLSKMFI